MLPGQISLTLTLSINPYHPLVLAGLLNYILCLHRANVDKFLLVSEYCHVHV